MSKTLEIATDVPFSVPNAMDVVIDLPKKHFSANPRVVAVVTLASIAVGGYLLYKRVQKQNAEKAELSDAEIEEVVTPAADDEPQKLKSVKSRANPNEGSPAV